MSIDLGSQSVAESKERLEPHASSDELIRSSTVLNEISLSILECMRRHGQEHVLDPSSLHLYRDQWTRIGIRAFFLRPWKNRIEIDQMAVEVITACTDKTEVHYHNHSFAVVTILGPWEGVKEPSGCHYFYGDAIESFTACSGITLQIPPGKIHGFRSPCGANPLTFLSVQSRRIEEDFHPL